MTDTLMPADWPFDPEAASAVEAAKLAIVPILAAHGVATVVIEYDGYGDEGQIEAITAFDGAGGARPIPEAACPRYDSRVGGVTVADATLAEALDTLGYEVLAACFAGWENNEGALGSVTLDVAARAIRIEHDWRVTATERAERVL